MRKRPEVGTGLGLCKGALVTAFGRQRLEAFSCLKFYFDSNLGHVISQSFTWVLSSSRGTEEPKETTHQHPRTISAPGTLPVDGEDLYGILAQSVAV